MYNIVLGLFYPDRPKTVKQWALLLRIFEPRPSTLPGEMNLKNIIPKNFPYIKRIVTSSAYVHAGLRGSGIDVIPVWSPEVHFLFDSSLSIDQIRQRLIKQDIQNIFFSPRSLNALYLRRFPFFGKDLITWKILVRNENSYLLQSPAVKK